MKAAAYEALRRDAGRMAESPGPSELAVQAGIYAGEYGFSWRGEDGEPIEVEHFGHWNREPGPDFCGARASINGVAVQGDIEVDPRDRDWEDHGHSANDHFNNVILHLFLRRGTKRFFTRTKNDRSVPQVCLAGTRPARVGISRHPGGTLDPGRARALIEEAARFRLLRKGELFGRSVRLHGIDDALFQSLAAGLGYKNNKIPFQLVAQRAGLRRAGGPDGEALVMGLAGFLEAGHFDRGEGEAREYLASLWKAWWALRDREARLVLPADAWTFSGLRPPNHPHRRMGALCAVARAFPPLRRAIRDADPTGFVEALTGLEHTYWSRHFRIEGDRLGRKTALIGADRASDLAINAFLPALPPETAWRVLGGLPAPTPSGRVARAAVWLCGSAADEVSRTAMCQQGLLQLHEDFLPRDPEALWDSYSRQSVLFKD